TKVAQPLQPFVDIEKSRLASHRPSSPTVIGAIESETGRSGEVFRTVQLICASVLPFLRTEP
ncbi:MAG: hypothetical protein O9313_19140, partial [Acetobacteraceae bacterium]|nr:hypothetical protein [Acetobacteraceae bacterium]